uniref:Endonuclease/exonuclease/phosphatase domain-containing protein n=2 Tax=Lotharella globosa TaxID=91324 RepID=A0A7S3YG33_9EUKA
MFVRTRRFKVINGSLISFARMSEDYFRSLGAHEGSFNDLDLMARMGAQDDKALIALLEDRGTQQRMVAVSTHLYWNPKEPHVKVLQAYLLSKALDEFIQRNNLDPEIPLVVAGDFNSLPNKTEPDIYDPVIPPAGLPSGAYAGLTTGCLDTKHPDHPKQRTMAECVGDLKFAFELTSAYAHVFGTEPLITTKTDKFSGTLDYIFVRNTKVASALGMPFDKDSVEGFGPIPNAVFPSDHIAIVSDLILP